MKYIRNLAIILLFAMLCTTAAAASKPIVVITSNAVLADLVQTVGGRLVQVTPVVSLTACAHEYEPKTGDMKLVAGADVYVKEGFGSDGWADRLIARTRKRNLVVIDASEGIKTESHPYGNPEYVADISKHIAAKLARVKPDSADVFKARAERYGEELRRLDIWAEQAIAPVRTVSVLSYSQGFESLFETLQLKPVMTVEEFHEQDVTPRRLAEAARAGRAKKVRVVVGDRNFPDMPKVLAKEIGCKTLLLWPTVGQGLTYVQTFKSNVSALLEALK